MYCGTSRSGLPFPDELSLAASFGPLTWLDIETTGLNPRTSHVTLIGYLIPADLGRELVQVFVEAPEEEAEALSTAFRELRRASTVITFNGGRFDLPFLRERSARFGMQMPMMHHRDLLDEALAWDPRRRIVPDHRLQTLMQHFGLARHDPRSGYDMVTIYERWLERRQVEDRQSILDHNADDLLKLPELTVQLICRRPPCAQFGAGQPVRITGSTGRCVRRRSDDGRR